jgi:hypothetical protein
MPTIQVNPYYFVELGNLPFPLMLARLFLDGGWIPVLLVMLRGFWLLWVQSRQAKFASGLTFTLLAIDIPRNNEQTPLAVEQIFSHISGAYSGFDRYEKYWIGKINPNFSFELVSIDGYVQYLIRCATKYRDLVESSIYAQYPDAEITEVADYADKVPSTFPHPEYDLFGTEFVLKKPFSFPIRTYPQFEHKAAEENIFKDPMSAVLEVMASLKPGEQMWMQILCTPCDDSWQKKSDELVDKMLGRKKPPQKGVAEQILEIPIAAVNELTNFGPPADAKKSDATPKMLQLSPGERGVLEAVQMKSSKIGFMTKIRIVYSGRRDVFQKGRFTSLKGAFGQFSALNMNAFKNYGNVTPKSDYFWQRWSESDKKMRILRNYKNRSNNGAPPYIMNTEELATIYHFPMISVKAPLVKKTEAKRAEPPPYLPYEGKFPTANIEAKPKPAPKPASDDEIYDEEVPDNLPFA